MLATPFIYIYIFFLYAVYTLRDGMVSSVLYYYINDSTVFRSFTMYEKKEKKLNFHFILRERVFIYYTSVRNDFAIRQRNSGVRIDLRGIEFSPFELYNVILDLFSLDSTWYRTFAHIKICPMPRTTL